MKFSVSCGAPNWGPAVWKDVLFVIFSRNLQVSQYQVITTYLSACISDLFPEKGFVRQSASWKPLGFLYFGSLSLGESSHQVSSLITVRSCRAVYGSWHWAESAFEKPQIKVSWAVQICWRWMLTWLQDESGIMYSQTLGNVWCKEWIVTWAMNADSSPHWPDSYREHPPQGKILTVENYPLRRRRCVRNSVFSAQFFCKSKPALKHSVFKKWQKRM